MGGNPVTKFLKRIGVAYCDYAKQVGSRQNVLLLLIAILILMALPLVACLPPELSGYQTYQIEDGSGQWQSETWIDMPQQP